MQDIKAEKIKLNSEQQKAVEDIYGPLLVLAGPGTTNPTTGIESC